MNEHIEQAIQNFRTASIRYTKTERYYRGDHDLAFATDKFQNAFGSLFREFAMNLCPAICDAVRDKLKVTGFGVQSAGLQRRVRRRSVKEDFTKRTVIDVRATGTDLQYDIHRIWNRNRMAQRAGELHKEALKNGDAYAVVWFDSAGQVTIYPQRASTCTVFYDEELPGRVAWAAKYWRTADKRTRLNLFYPDRIEKYVSKKESEATLPEAKEFVSLASPISKAPSLTSIDLPLGAQDLGYGTIPNPYGIVPVFHFANNTDIGAFGQSELLQAIPVQDGLNKSVLDMLVAMEFSAYRQRWAAGIEIEYDDEGKAAAPFTAGIEHLWIAQDPNARFGDFNTANLEQFLKVKDSFRVDMASVTGTPLHYFLQNARGFASGESLKKNETRFLAKVRDRQTAFGQTWADLMSFAVNLAGHGTGIELLTNWEDPAPTEEKEFLENVILKKQIGLSVEQALKEAGYGDIDVKRMIGK